MSITGLLIEPAPVDGGECDNCDAVIIDWHRSGDRRAPNEPVRCV
jgi:hypothetical protein